MASKFGNYNTESLSQLRGPPGVGFKLTPEGNYDLQSKKLVNGAPPDDDNDMATKGWVNSSLAPLEQAIQDGTFDTVTANMKVVTDAIDEKTVDVGVMIDGVLLKDGKMTADEITTDTISEKTTGNGVTIDGILLKDNGIIFTNDSKISNIINGYLNVSTAAGGDAILAVNTLQANNLQPAGALEYILIHKSLIPAVINSLQFGDPIDYYKSIYVSTNYTNTINELTTDSGVTVDGVLLKDNTITVDTLQCNHLVFDSVYDAEATLSSAQTLTNNIEATVLFNNEVLDNSNSYDTSTGVYTAATAGIYLVDASIAFPPNSTGNRIIKLQKNDTDNHAQVLPGVAANSAYLNLCCSIRVAVNDTLRIRAYQSSGGDLNISSGSLRIHLIRCV